MLSPAFVLSLTWSLLGASTAAAAAGTAAAAPPPPPVKLGHQYAFPVDGPDSPACLDGKAYTITYQLSSSGSTKWSFSLPGGGWCYNEIGCLFRANSTGLGKSNGGSGTNAHYRCQDDTVDDNCVVLHYCDGSSFASYRAEPWPVPEAVAGVPGKTVTFRGIRNLDATFDWCAKNGLFVAIRLEIETAKRKETLREVNHAFCRAFQHGLANATEIHIGGVRERLFVAISLCVIVDYLPRQARDKYSSEHQWRFRRPPLAGSRRSSTPIVWPTASRRMAAAMPPLLQTLSTVTSSTTRIMPTTGATLPFTCATCTA